MAVLAASGLSKSYAARTLFDQVSFELAPKDKVGLVGVNGCGKTTLFRILSGAEAPDAGNVYQSKEVRLGVLQQSVERPAQSYMPMCWMPFPIYCRRRRNSTR